MLEKGAPTAVGAQRRPVHSIRMPGGQQLEESINYIGIARPAGTAWPTSGST